MVSLGYGDAKIANDFVEVFHCRSFPLTGGFDKHVRAAQMTVQQLEVLRWIELCSRGSVDERTWTLDAEALEETVSTVDKGWLAECKDVDLKGRFIARRFPTQQKAR